MVHFVFHMDTEGKGTGTEKGVAPLVEADRVSPRFLDFSCLSYPLINYATVVRKSWFQVTVPPGTLRRGAPWSCRLCRAPRSTDVMSNSPFSSDSGCASLQTIGRVELDITSC